MPDDTTQQSSSQQQSPSGSTQASSGADGQAAQASNQNSQTTTAAQAPARPEWAPERYWDASKNELKGADLRKDFDQLSAWKAAEDSKRATLPPDPNGYKVETTSNFKPPEGVEWKLDADDPAWGVARTVAHKYGIPQAALNEFADAFAGYMVGDAAKMQAAAKGEIAKLGTAGPARVDAVTKWLEATAGDKFKGLAGVIRYAPRADVVEGIEHLMQVVTNQGGGSFSGAHRDPGSGDGKIPGYATMTFEQRRHAQEMAKASGRRA